MPESVIPVSTEVKFNIQVSDALTQNVKPLLHEIRHAMAALIEDGKSSIIDLRSIPLAPGEEVSILNTLGQGEVMAEMNTLGLSEVFETRFAGVWVVTHFNDEGTIISRFIEVTTIPEILRSQTEDMQTAYDEISELLEDK